jgi:hypothetical protein
MARGIWLVDWVLLMGRSKQARSSVTASLGLHRLSDSARSALFRRVGRPRSLSDGLVQRYGEERERWVRSAAAVRAQVIDALLAGEEIEAEGAGRRLGYELGRTHLTFAIWSDAPHDQGDIALAMIERAALRLVSSLGMAEHTITNRIRAAQEFLPHPIEQRACELQVALRLIGLAQSG